MKPPNYRSTMHDLIQFIIGVLLLALSTITVSSFFIILQSKVRVFIHLTNISSLCDIRSTEKQFLDKRQTSNVNYL